MNKRNKSTIQKIAIPVLVGFFLLVISTTYNSAGNDFADIGYKLSASDWIPKDGTLEVELDLKNDGNMNCVPTSTVFVENATIQKVEINKVQQINLGRYCNLTDKTATVSHLIVEKDRSFTNWATVTVIPNEGTSSFAVYSLVTLPTDLLHPNSKVTPTIPSDLFYIVTNQGEYLLAD